MTLRDLYKKAHWQVTGPTFYMLHLLFDEHHKEQASLIDMVGERIQTLGALAIAMSADVAERSRIERPPACREQVPVMLSRLIEAHGKVIEEARKATRIAQKNGDESTANLLTSFILPQNEKRGVVSWRRTSSRPPSCARTIDHLAGGRALARKAGARPIATPHQPSRMIGPAMSPPWAFSTTWEGSHLSCA
ncbi:MAG: DNA starvation/stationary phase protection protein [Polyangiaceae bacterium]